MSAEVVIVVDGAPVIARAGTSVAVALTETGRLAWRTTRFGGAPRGLFCGIGVCYDCLVEIDGAPAQRACIVPVADGMKVNTRAGHE
ncbi:(2Fe-2S)-binding protein [Planctomonas sp. JC2975]|uniref:(2Fe-2S)-binding protein n=1 Tax=Planctomonas sp. JC2975 TaxID=2729626 RepID=UPI001473EE09|nr:(2Fe-2S)-binding protein [Planctomonas sp. JC2975]NNC11266.1 (2Fe-2S)-binding protein [Planctomonas sp. JC2975]